MSHISPCRRRGPVVSVNFFVVVCTCVIQGLPQTGLVQNKKSSHDLGVTRTCFYYFEYQIGEYGLHWNCRIVLESGACPLNRGQSHDWLDDAYLTK